MTQTTNTANMSGQLTSANALQYMLGGNATFTIVDIPNEMRFTFKITAIHGKLSEPIRFVKLMTGSDNESNFSYFAFIRLTEKSFTYHYGGQKARVGKDTDSVTMFEVVLAHLRQGRLPGYWQIFHEGSCCKCGRKLTVPESVSDGIGPECKKYFIANKIQY